MLRLPPKENMKENDICKFCKKGKVKLVKADEPWHGDYLICPICQSTYNIGE